MSIPTGAQSVLTEHSNLAWWTMWFFGAYALVRLGAHLWSKARNRVVVQGLLFAVALGGSYLLYQTGDHGAEMVYRYGVGVSQPETEEAEAKPGLTIGKSGWQWRPQSVRAWTERMTWLEGTPDTVRARLDTLSDGSVALALTPEAPVTFVVPDTLGAAQVTTRLNLDDFEGTVSLLHHLRNTQNYDFLRVGGSTMQQGRVADGKRTVMEESTADLSGWRNVRVVGDGTHFRGYVDGEQLTHPHGEAVGPGVVGLRLEGTGTVRLRRLSAQAL